MNFKIICPEKELCTDNGVMIAWNGVEKWREGIDIIPPSRLDTVDIEPKYERLKNAEQSNAKILSLL